MDDFDARLNALKEWNYYYKYINNIKYYLLYIRLNNNNIFLKITM